MATIKMAILKRHALQIFNRTYYTYVKEPTMPISGKEPKWTDAKGAFGCCLKSCSTVFITGAAATPINLVRAMAEVAKEKCLKNITVCHMHMEGPAPHVEDEYADHFYDVSFFVGKNVRKAVNSGRADCIPIFLSEIPKIFFKEVMIPQIVLIKVSPPDCHGYCSMGTGADATRGALENCCTIIAEVNKNMPRTFGDTNIHISHIDYAVCSDDPMITHPAPELGDTERRIGKLVAEHLVDNGATLQMGIGAIPDGVLAELGCHKDLGIHTEMFSDGVLHLVETGALTNNKKTMWKGNIVSTFLLGTQALYDFINNNPCIRMLRVETTNNVRIITKQHKMTAINSAIEVDITGQVCADSIGPRIYSGFGGQVDFIRGSGAALDGMGKPIIALPSVTKKGDSKIVITLKEGAGVTTTRGHVHYVVTEYGIAQLWGKTLRQRAYNLIQIAHPDHRESLEKAAFERLKAMPEP